MKITKCTKMAEDWSNVEQKFHLRIPIRVQYNRHRLREWHIVPCRNLAYVVYQYYAFSETYKQGMYSDLGTL